MFATETYPDYVNIALAAFLTIASLAVLALIVYAAKDLKRDD